jgi:acetyl-CoA acetyltransferase
MTRTPHAAIAGIGLTRQAKQLHTTTVKVCLEASRLALADAGMTIDDIDGIAARWPGPGGTVFEPGSVDWSGVFGKPFRWVCDTYPQGVPGTLDAAAAIAAGLCDNVLVVGGQAGLAGGNKVVDYTRPDNEFVACWGALTAAHFALVAQVYLHRHDPDRVKLADIAATIRNAGAANPEAVLTGKGPFTASDILASPMIAEPFRLLDLCLASEGAAAVIITSPEKARDCPSPPALILGGGSEWHRQQYVDPPRYDEVWSIGSDAYERTFSAAGLTPDDIDVFELYDINTIEVVRQFETLGLCGEGDGVDYIAAAGIDRNGRHPTNTDGGLLSFSHIGWGGPQLKLVEAVRQLRGIAGPGQVDDVETVFVTGAGSGAQYHNCLILGSHR